MSKLNEAADMNAEKFLARNSKLKGEELKSAFESAYFWAGTSEGKESLRDLLNTYDPLKEFASELEDYMKQADAAKGTVNTNPNRQFGASNQPTVRRSGGGLFEEKLRMQMLAGIITESEYKAKLDEAEGRDLYKTAGEMISQVGLFTQEIADELEAENRGNLYRFFNTPEEKAELIKISEAYPAYLAKVKAMMDELMSDPMYQVAVGDARDKVNPLEKAYYRAKMYNMYK
jgi:hypothetical protein